LTAAGQLERAIDLQKAAHRLRPVAADPAAVEAKSRMTVEVVDPFFNVSIDETRFDMPYLRAHAPLAAVAFGLALRRPGDDL
jgi:Tfp pilus assembly PilM family ATPase